MSSLVLLGLHVWALSVLIFTLHYYSPRFGFTPLLMILGGITVFTQSQLGIFIEPTSDLVMFISSNALVPVILVAVLVIYVANGAAPARMTVFAVMGVSIMTLLLLQLYRVYLSLPNGGTIRTISPDQLIAALDLRITIGSLSAFLIDMFVIAVFYQGVRNYAPRLPEAMVIGIALLAALWTDALVFRFVTDLGRIDFVQFLPGDVVGKTLSVLLLWPPAAYYLTRIAPKLPGHVGSANRRTLDVLFGSFEAIKQELLRTEEALAQSEAERRKEAEYLGLISNNINEALWLVSRGQQDHAFYVNHAYEQIWGRTAPTIYADADAFAASIHPEDRERVLSGLAKQAEGNYNVEYRILRPDGTIRWLRDRTFPVRNERGEYERIAGITEDITERKQLEKQQLELAVEREKVKLLRDFIGEASHDLKNPLTSINLKIEQLRRTADPERQAKHLHDMEMLSRRMSRMIDDLITLARLENLKELKLIRLNLNQMIDDICQLMRPLIDEKKLELALDLKNGEFSMYGSQRDLERALANLIENAVHYTPQGGQVSVQTESQEREVLIRVADTGMGIPEVEQANIFNRFYRASNARSISGTGLGLAIVKKVIDQHQGQIEVTSALGTGTTFVLRLPKAE
ncbi:MAG: ATP-binding protein [Anaerolineae bacterium]